MSKTRLIQACAGVALAIGVANTASAELMIDLRLPSSVSTIPGVIVLPDKTVDVSLAAPGTRIPIEVFAVVTGPGTGPEGFQSAQGSFVSNRSGGGPTGAILPAGDVEEVNFTETIPAFSPYTGNGATRGLSKEIGAADGIIDLGDDVRRGDTDLGGLVVFRSPGIQVTSGTVIPNGREFRIGRVEFQVGDEVTPGDASINWVFRQNLAGGPQSEAALFRFDTTNPADGTHGVSVGTPVTFSGGVIPEPATIGLAAVGALGLLARRRRN